MVKPIFTRHNIEVVFNYADDNIEIIGYPNELGQAILNIINNAKDALIEYNKEYKKIEIILMKIDGEINLIIKDNAGGIPMNIINKIFDPYFSTKDSKNGTGLGLYMTKLIIEDHMGGELSVSNNESGAKFKILLVEKGTYI